MNRPILAEILIHTQSGVLPQTALLNTFFNMNKYEYMTRSYKLDLKFFEYFKDKEFDIKSIEDWEQWYSALLELGLDKDKLIIEHEHGINLITEGLWNMNEILDYTKTLRPLKLEKEWDEKFLKYRPKAAHARRRGMTKALGLRNQSSRIITV